MQQAKNVFTNHKGNTYYFDFNFQVGTSILHTGLAQLSGKSNRIGVLLEKREKI